MTVASGVFVHVNVFTPASTAAIEYLLARTIVGAPIRAPLSSAAPLEFINTFDLSETITGPVTRQHYGPYKAHLPL